MIKDFAFLADVTVKIVVSISSVAFGLGMAVSGYMAEQQAKNAEQDRQIEELKKDVRSARRSRTPSKTGNRICVGSLESFEQDRSTTG